MDTPLDTSVHLEIGTRLKSLHGCGGMSPGDTVFVTREYVPSASYIYFKNERTGESCCEPPRFFARLPEEIETALPLGTRVFIHEDAKCATNQEELAEREEFADTDYVGVIVSDKDEDNDYRVALSLEEPSNYYFVNEQYLTVVADETDVPQTTNNSQEGENTMSKFYKVIKDTPELVAGAILQQYSGEEYRAISDLWNTDGVSEDRVVKVQEPAKQSDYYTRVWQMNTGEQVVYVDRATAREIQNAKVTYTAPKAAK